MLAQYLGTCSNEIIIDFIDGKMTDLYTFLEKQDNNIDSNIKNLASFFKIVAACAKKLLPLASPNPDPNLVQSLSTFMKKTITINIGLRHDLFPRLQSQQSLLENVYHLVNFMCDFDMGIAEVFVEQYNYNLIWFFKFCLFDMKIRSQNINFKELWKFMLVHVLTNNKFQNFAFNELLTFYKEKEAYVPVVDESKSKVSEDLVKEFAEAWSTMLKYSSQENIILFFNLNGCHSLAKELKFFNTDQTSFFDMIDVIFDKLGRLPNLSLLNQKFMTEFSDLYANMVMEHLQKKGRKPGAKDSFYHELLRKISKVHPPLYEKLNPQPQQIEITEEGKIKFPNQQEKKEETPKKPDPSLFVDTSIPKKTPTKETAKPSNKKEKEKQKKRSETSSESSSDETAERETEETEAEENTDDQDSADDGSSKNSTINNEKYQQLHQRTNNHPLSVNLAREKQVHSTSSKAPVKKNTSKWSQSEDRPQNSQPTKPFVASQDLLRSTSHSQKSETDDEKDLIPIHYPPAKYSQASTDGNLEEAAANFLSQNVEEDDYMKGIDQVEQLSLAERGREDAIFNRFCEDAGKERENEEDHGSSEDQDPSSHFDSFFQSKKKATPTTSRDKERAMSEVISETFEVDTQSDGSFHNSQNGESALAAHVVEEEEYEEEREGYERNEDNKQASSYSAQEISDDEVNEEYNQQNQSHTQEENEVSESNQEEYKQQQDASPSTFQNENLALPSHLSKENQGHRDMSLVQSDVSSPSKEARSSPPVHVPIFDQT
jgi:hypothetical protein